MRLTRGKISTRMSVTSRRMRLRTKALTGGRRWTRDDRDDEEDDDEDGDEDDTETTTRLLGRRGRLGLVGPWILLRFLSGHGEVTLAGQSHRDLSLGTFVGPSRHPSSSLSRARAIIFVSPVNDARETLFLSRTLFSPVSLFIRGFLPTTTCTRYKRRVPRVTSRGWRAPKGPPTTLGRRTKRKREIEKTRF